MAMSRKISGLKRFVVPGVLAAVILSVVSCFDMYSGVLDSADSGKFKFAILETMYGTSSSRLLVNDGFISYTQSSWTPGSSLSRSSALADFNNDGIQDVLLIIEGSSHQLWISNNDGIPTTQYFISNALVTRDAVVADFDRDGWLDIFTVSNTGGAHKFYRNNHNNTFSEPWTQTANFANSYAVTEGDFNNDGYIDVFVGNNAAPSECWINDLPNSGTFIRYWVAATGRNTVDVKAADFDQDGDLDVIEINASSDVSRIWSNNGQGQFTEVWNSSLTTYQSTSCTIGDIDADRYLDVVITNSSPSNLLILLNNGNNTFTERTSPTIEPSFTSVVADLDADGDLDILIGENSSLRIYNNDSYGNFSFNKEYYYTGARSSLSIAVFNH